MMQSEFEAGIGYEVPTYVFEKVEFVYMNSDFFSCKEQVYSFWKKYDLNGFERMVPDIMAKLNAQKKVKELEAKLEAVRRCLE